MPVSSFEIATDRDVVFLDQREDGLELFLLAGDRIDQRPAFCHFQSGLDGGGNGGINGKWNINQFLDDPSAS